MLTYYKNLLKFCRMSGPTNFKTGNDDVSPMKVKRKNKYISSDLIGNMLYIFINFDSITPEGGTFTVDITLDIDMPIEKKYLKAVKINEMGPILCVKILLDL